MFHSTVKYLPIYLSTPLQVQLVLVHLWMYNSIEYSIVHLLFAATSSRALMAGEEKRPDLKVIYWQDRYLFGSALLLHQQG